MAKPEVEKIQEQNKETVKKILSKTGWTRFTLYFILAVLIWNTFQIWAMIGVVGRVEKYNQGVVDEVGGLTGDVKLFAGDLNEIRKFLLLPEKNYSVDQSGGEDVGKDQDKGSENAVAMFAFLDSLVSTEKQTQNRQAAQGPFEALLTNAEFNSKLTGAQILPAEKGDLQIKYNDGAAVLSDGTKNELFGQPLYNLVFDADNNLFLVQSALGEGKFPDFGKADFAVKLADFMLKNLEMVRAAKLKSIEVAKAEDEKARQLVEQTLQQKKQELESLVKDKAFVETLAGVGLNVAEKPREETGKYIFDVLDATGKLKFSLALEISSGMIKVLRDNQEIDIKSFLEDGSKKNF